MKIVSLAVLFASLLFFSFAHATPPTKPPVFLKLNATVSVGGKEYPFDFSWTRKNIEGWSFDRGHYSDWVSSNRSMLRILDQRFAVIFSLPNDLQLQEARYRPSVFLLERANPTFLRSYPALGVGVKTDGFFELTHFKISSFAQPVDAMPMTKEELALMAQVEKREYAYLFGMSFRKSQWSQSKDLTRKLSGFRDFVLLGKNALWGQETPPVWTAFVAFNSGIAMKMEPYLFGFEQKEGSWVPLKYAGVYWCRAGLKKEKGPIRIWYDSHHFDQQQNEMLFDGVTQRLTIIWNYPVNFHPDN